MAGSYTTGVNFDLHTLYEMDRNANELGISRSKFIQIAVRNQNKLYTKHKVRDYIDSLNEKELNTLKDLIKKGAI